MKRSVVAALGAALIATLGANSAAQASIIDFGVAVLDGTIDYTGTSLDASSALDLDGALLLVTAVGAGDASGLALFDTITLSAATSPPSSAIIYGFGTGPAPLATDVVKSWSDSLGSFSETLTTVLSIDRATTDAITVTLTGTVTGPGFVDVPAELILSATQAGGPGNVVSASLTNTSRLAIPEASTWAMLALGFSALGYAASRRRKTNIATLSA